jgi:hypothetical protein
MSSEFATLAKMFAGNTNVRVVFEKTGTPRTDGTTIWLPEDICNKSVYPTLSALLHESHHVKLSEMPKANKSGATYEMVRDIRNAISRGGQALKGQRPSKIDVDGSLMDMDTFDTESNAVKSGMLSSDSAIAHAINCLEDCRIDNVIFGEFCNARYLYQFLVKAALAKAAEEKPEDGENIDTIIPRIYAYVYLKAIGYGDMYPWKQTQAFIEKRFGKRIDEIIEHTVGTPSIRDLELPVIRLIQVLDTLMGDPQYQKAQLPKLTQTLQSEIDNEKAKNKKSSDKNEKFIKKHEADLREANTKTEKLQKERDLIRNQSAEMYKKMQADGRSGNSKVNQQKMKDFDKASQDLMTEMNKIRNEKKSHERKLRGRNKKQVKLNEIINKKENEKRRINELIEGGHDNGYGIPGVSYGYESMNDFKALEKSKDKFEEAVAPMHNFEGNLEVIFSRLKHVESYSPKCGYLNMKSAYKIFDSSNEGNLKDLFKYSQAKRVFKNKVAFVLDTSGSMGGRRGCSLSTRNNYGIMMEVMSNLFSVIERKREEYNIEYSINPFSDNVNCVKDYDEELDAKHVTSPNGLAELIDRKHRGGGGTDIIRAIKKVKTTLDDVAHPNDNTFVVVVTDGEFDDSAMKEILQKYNYEKDKIIFVGIDKESGERKEAQYVQNLVDCEEAETEGRTVSSYENNRRNFYEKILMKRFCHDTEGMEKALLEGFDKII